MTSFSEIGLQENILKAVQELGFETPTPIQAQTIPQLLNSDQDLIGFAQTGTGKTAAFGLPAIQSVDTNSKNTQTLILAPTRELCMQITKDLTSYSKYIKKLNVVPVYGGASINTQIRQLKSGAQIVVATPGRAIDLINRKKLLLNGVQHVILDEADEMLSMGFQEDLNIILSNTDNNRQTSLFSATMSKEIKGITKKYMNSPVEISVAEVNSAATNVEHLYYTVNASNRYEVIKRIADSNPDFYGIVFCRTRRETQKVAKDLLRDGYNADALNGDLSQAQRDAVMNKFRSGQLQIMVATDVAARGLDVDDLTHIINYNLPDDLEVYIHRSGRTGRAGNSGKSVAIVTPREVSRINHISRKYKIKFSKSTVPDGEEICTRQLYKLIDKIKNTTVNEEQIDRFLPNIYDKLDDLDREELIKRFVSAEFNSFLDYYKNAKDINVSDGKKKHEKKRGRTSFVRFHLNVGSKNKIKPARLIGMINETLGNDNSDIGEIEILKTFSFFEVEEAVADDIFKGLNGQSLGPVELRVELAKETKKSSSGRKSYRRKSKRYDDKRKKRRRR
ncbi:MAG: DEAD/DEAH box helicase [Bacteroidota bacterium]|nr:DEAD/DEAH box helicase [Bacteroidota bacterium]